MINYTLINTILEIQKEYFGKIEFDDMTDKLFNRFKLEEFENGASKIVLMDKYYVYKIAAEPGVNNYGKFQYEVLNEMGISLMWVEPEGFAPIEIQKRYRHLSYEESYHINRVCEDTKLEKTLSKLSNCRCNICSYLIPQVSFILHKIKGRGYTDYSDLHSANIMKDYHNRFVIIDF